METRKAKRRSRRLVEYTQGKEAVPFYPALAVPDPDLIDAATLMEGGSVLTLSRTLALTSQRAEG